MPMLNWIGKEAHKDVPCQLLESATELACGEVSSAT